MQRAVSTLSSKGQVTVPESIRRRLHLERGDRLEWETSADGVVVRKVGGKLSELVGMLGAPRRRLSVRQQDEAVKRRLRETHRGQR